MNTEPDQEAEAFGAECEELLASLAERFGDLMETPLTLPTGIAESTAKSYRKALRFETALGDVAGAKRIKAALGINEKKNGAFRPMAGILIALESIQELLRNSGLLEEQVIDQWLLGETLNAIMADKNSWPVHGMEAVDLLCCLLSQTRQAQSDETPERQFMQSIRALSDSRGGHFSAFMKVQHLHGKKWFRERQLTILAAWLMAQTLPETTEIIDATEAAAGEPAIPNAWLDAIEQLETTAFLSGYELGALLKKIG
jgi:hypothetical protein